MIRFKLFDETSGIDYDEQKYIINLNFADSDEFNEFAAQESDFDNFMEKMESGDKPWCGVHDFDGSTDDDGIEYVGFSSYEIQDFDTALQKWYNFFDKHKKIQK